LKDALTGEILNQIRVVSNYAFDYNKHVICTTIGDIKEENNIEDRDAIEKKLTVILKNLYDRRNAEFDAFHYNGRKLSYYANESWADDVMKLCLNAIYDGKVYHRNLYLKILERFYERVKLQFIENLKKM
jgi:hypothetical protein